MLQDYYSIIIALMLSIGGEGAAECELKCFRQYLNNETILHLKEKKTRHLTSRYNLEYIGLIFKILSLANS